MRISFHGGAEGVTGSCSLIEVEGSKLLIDCGMFQGGRFSEAKNHDPFGFDPKELRGVFITHSHLDHVGRLPLLVAKGYTGFFYATPPTVELAMLVLEDALHIMEENYLRYGEPTLYDAEMVAAVSERFRAVDYYEPMHLPGSTGNPITITFRDAGHIFGSAFIEIAGDGKRAVFSGDIGNVHAPIVRDTDTLPDGLDVLISESTYGDRVHETTSSRDDLVAEEVLSAMARGGVLLIPAFAIERTQELLYVLDDLLDRQKRLPAVPIFLDSPLAIKATQVFRKYPQYYDADARNIFSAGDDLFQFAGLTLCASKDESKQINNVPGQKIIIAGGGMLNGGRIMHHVMRYASDPKNTLLFIGYQAEGTPGRAILEGKESISIFGEQVPVHCRVRSLNSLSAHADQNKILQWIQACGVLPRRVILNHGEPAAAQALAIKIFAEAGVPSAPARLNEWVEIE